MDGGTALDPMLRMLLALAGVCALAWVVLSLLARRGLLQFASGLAGKSGRLRVLERVSLSPRRQLFLVQVDARVFLVGTGDAGPPALIAELEGEDRERPLRAARMEAAS